MTAPARMSTRELVAELSRLARIPSVAFPGHPPGPVHAAAAATADLLRRSGAHNARLLDVPGGYPAVYADVPGPAGAPTVLLYAHYDVQPAGDAEQWTSDPWQPVLRDGRLYGRGTADDKAGIVMHAGTLSAFAGRPPVGVKILVEGEEETASHLASAVTPELVSADAVIIADAGNLACGQPCLTTSLRGVARCVVTVRIPQRPVHSGLFGGVVPDAVQVLVGALARLHDESGDVAVEGLGPARPAATELDAAIVRAAAGLAPGVPLQGSGTPASRLWSGTSITPLAVEPCAADGAPAAVQNRAQAQLALRVAPDQDVDEAIALVAGQLRRSVAPGVAVDVTVLRARNGVATGDGPVRRHALAALERAYGKPASLIGSGASVPAAELLHRLLPHAELVVWGPQDLGRSAIHAPDESVDLAELEQLVEAQVRLLGSLPRG